MILKLGKNIIDIDVEKTRLFYDRADSITSGCSCDGCRNYEKATEVFPDSVKNFFSLIGVNLQKAAEIITYCSEEDGRKIYYGGFYHICGRCLTETECWVYTENTDMVKELDQNGFYTISDGFSVGFTTAIDLLEDNFPMPALQMEINFHCPWILEKKNTYR